jgi:ER-bound oxygenase mpaB/B'/Rubber oxygenase, catalytic domain
VQYGDALLDSLRQEGDPTADAVIQELAETGEIRAVSKVLRHLVDNDQPIPAELPGSIARWLEDTAALPAWADYDRMVHGADLVVDHGPQVAMILATASLVYSYAGYPGVKVLTFSHRLDQDPYRRVGETAQFVLTVTNPGSLLPGGKGIRKIQKVRLLHASIRQEDLLGTMLSFSEIVVKSLRKLGVRVSDEEGEDYLYLWRAVGEMLGIRPDILPHDMRAARAGADAIMRRHHQPSEDGIAMTRALLEMHANSMPGPKFAGVAPALLRFLAGDEVCDMMEVPRTSWDRAMALNRRLGRIVDLAQSAPGMSSFVNMLGAVILNQQATKMAGRRSASFAIPVPPEMSQRWSASGVFPTIDESALRQAEAEA